MHLDHNIKLPRITYLNYSSSGLSPLLMIILMIMTMIEKMGNNNDNIMKNSAKACDISFIMLMDF